MVKGGTGGGNTKSGLEFEGKTDLAGFLRNYRDYEVSDGNVFFKGEKVARIFKKHAFYKFLDELKIDWRSRVSKKLLPDDSIFIIVRNTLYIIECKFQNVAGSVDEKLQTCDFKKKQYKRLLAPANIVVEYVYLLSDWFRKPEYADVLNYIIDVGCSYYFEHIPLWQLGLPVSERK